MTHLKRGEEKVTDTPEVDNQLSFSSSPWESRYVGHFKGIHRQWRHVVSDGTKHPQKHGSAQASGDTGSGVM